MKVRAGFVSNSSSSSFVVLGLKVTEEMLSEFNAKSEKTWNALIKEKFPKVRFIDADSVGTDLLGIRFHSGLEESDVQETDIMELIEILQNLKTDMSIDSEIKLYSGSEYC
jgi:hypothetical protein